MPPMIPQTTEGDALDAAVRAGADDEAARLRYAAWLARVGCREQAKLIASPVGVQMAAFCREHGVPVRLMLDLEVGAVADAGPEHFRAVAALMRSRTGQARAFREAILAANGEAIAATNKLADSLREAVAAINRPDGERMALLGEMSEAATRINDALRQVAEACLAVF
jgi:hypothetical protein